MSHRRRQSRVPLAFVAFAVVVTSAACASEVRPTALAECRPVTGGEALTPAATANREPGSPARITSSGRYEVASGCGSEVMQPAFMGRGSDLVVVGRGRRWSEGVRPCPRRGGCVYDSVRFSGPSHFVDRASAVSSLNGLLRERLRDIRSLHGLAASTACTGLGYFAEVRLHDGRDLARTVHAVGLLLDERNLHERVGVRLEAAPCDPLEGFVEVDDAVSAADSDGATAHAPAPAPEQPAPTHQR